MVSGSVIIDGGFVEEGVTIDREDRSVGVEESFVEVEIAVGIEEFVGIATGLVAAVSGLSFVSSLLMKIENNDVNEER